MAPLCEMCSNRPAEQGGSCVIAVGVPIGDLDAASWRRRKSGADEQVWAVRRAAESTIQFDFAECPQVHVASTHSRSPRSSLRPVVYVSTPESSPRCLPSRPSPVGADLPGGVSRSLVVCFPPDNTSRARVKYFYVSLNDSLACIVISLIYTRLLWEMQLFRCMKSPPAHIESRAKHERTQSATSPLHD